MHILTSSICISQLLAHHSSIGAVPVVMTHCPPLVIDAHLHSTLILIGASHQTNISISADTSRIDCNDNKEFCDVITESQVKLQSTC